MLRIGLPICWFRCLRLLIGEVFIAGDLVEPVTFDFLSLGSGAKIESIMRLQEAGGLAFFLSEQIRTDAGEDMSDDTVADLSR